MIIFPSDEFDVSLSCQHQGWSQTDNTLRWTRLNRAPDRALRKMTLKLDFLDFLDERNEKNEEIRIQTRVALQSLGEKFSGIDRVDCTTKQASAQILKSSLASIDPKVLPISSTTSGQTFSDLLWRSFSFSW
jgi:hypothetical protein